MILFIAVINCDYDSVTVLIQNYGFSFDDQWSQKFWKVRVFFIDKVPHHKEGMSW